MVRSPLDAVTQLKAPVPEQQTDAGSDRATACLTKAMIAFSSAGPILRIANEVGHMPPSSRCALASKPSVQQHTLKFVAGWKKSRHCRAPIWVCRNTSSTSASARAHSRWRRSIPPLSLGPREVARSPPRRPCRSCRFSNALCSVAAIIMACSSALNPPAASFLVVAMPPTVCDGAELSRLVMPMC